MLYFLHIPKTGGTSLINALRASTDLYVIPSTIPLTSKGYNLGSQVGRKVISGHVHYGIHEQLPGPYEYMTVLRHPVSRTMSSYKHVKRAIKKGNARRQSGAEHIGGTFQNFVSKSWIVKNLATRQLCGKGHADRSVLTQHDYDEALKNLKSIKYVGTLESIGDFWSRLQADYGFKAKLGYANVTSRNKASEVSPEDTDHILMNNYWDLKLYEVAKELACIK